MTVHGYKTDSISILLHSGAVDTDTNQRELGFLVCEEFVNCTDQFLIRLLLKDHSKYFGKIVFPSSFDNANYSCNVVILDSPREGSWRDVNAMLKRELEIKCFLPPKCICVYLYPTYFFSMGGTMK